MRKIIIIAILFFCGKNVFAQTTVANEMQANKKQNASVFQKIRPAFNNRKMAYARSFNSNEPPAKNNTAGKTPIVRANGQHARPAATVNNYKVTVNHIRYHINKTSVPHTTTIKKSR